MTWLGLGPDADYEMEADPAGQAFNDPALHAEGVREMEPVGPVQGPVGPMTERDHSDFSAVRSLGPMTDGEYNVDSLPSSGEVRRLSNTSLRPVEVPNRNDPPMGSVQAVPAVPGSKPQLVAPRSFNDAQEVADRFRGGAPVILNLQETDAELGRRLIDFCSGLCYGLRGQMQRVGDRVFLVTPADVQLSADDHRLMRDSGLLG